MTFAPGRAGELRHGGGRTRHGLELGSEPTEDAGQRGTQPTRVRVHGGVRRAGVRCEAFEHVHGDVGQSRRERPPFEAEHGAREPRRGAPAPRRGRVATVAACDELDVDRALLRGPDHRGLGVDPWQCPVDDRAPLVEHEPRLDTPLAQQGHGLLGRVARHLFGAAERQPDVAPRRDALVEQLLHRAADRDERALAVERAATPDMPLGDLGREGRAGPRRLVPHGDDVEVRHEDHRLLARPAGPAHEQGIAGDSLDLALRVQAREPCAQLGEERVEGLAVLLVAVPARHGRDADTGPQCLDRRGVMAGVRVGGVRRRHGWSVCRPAERRQGMPGRRAAVPR